LNTLKISALFSTFNRAELLDKALASLLTQTLPREYFEVVVIDDGSSDKTREIAEKYSNLLDLRYAYQPNSGLAEGKNHALRLARAPIVVFMDDDDIADGRLLEEHLLTHEKNPDPNIAVLGFTELQRDIASIPIMHFVTQVGCQLFNYPRLTDGDLLDYSYFWGGRSSCKLGFLQKHGVFNPVFRFGCEDVELGYRLSAHNLRVIYNQQARSTMIRALTLGDFCRRTERQGNSNWVFSQMHPGHEIESWADVIDLEPRWRRVEARFDHFSKSAADLETIVHARQRHGIEIDDLLLRLLHRAYWLTIDSHRLRGSWLARQASHADTSNKVH
jgi:glycosyltransferase involved in cell wall biosynthesis